MIKSNNNIRTLTLKHKDIEESILLPINLWTQAEQIKEDYLSVDLSKRINTEDLQPIDLATLYLESSLVRVLKDRELFLPLAEIIFEHLNDNYLKGNNIHSVSFKLSPSNYLYVIRNFYKAKKLLNHESEASGSAIFKQVATKEVSIFAVFSGQGTFDSYFDELNEIYTTYNGLISPYIIRMAEVIKEFSLEDFSQDLHTIDFDILKWLASPEKRPDIEYLISPAISLPLIGLIQLSHYYVSLKTLNFTPSEMAKHLIGTSGHSQGIISSTVISVSKTFEDYNENSIKALKLLSCIGARAQQCSPQVTLAPNVLKDSIENGEGNPSSMLSIFNLTYDQVKVYVDNVNAHLKEDRKIYINLVNGPRSIVCSGHPESLYGLNLSLRKIKAPAGLDQSRIPYSKRKINIVNRFLSISGPFHTPYLEPSISILEEDISKYNLDFVATSLNIPVYSTFSGENLFYSNNVTMDLVRQICTLPVNWELATKIKPLTHIIDFGPGGSSGIGGLTYRNKEGTGVQVIIASSMKGPNKNLTYKPDLYDMNVESIKFSIDWKKEYSPKLFKLACNEKLYLDTRFSRLLGKPPIMVAGMTPCTVSQKFVSATINAGYHVELAGGGHFNEKMLVNKIDSIIKNIPNGEGITLNMLYLNAYQWGFQFPLILKLRKQGYPINGICIAAGVPSIELADSIIKQLKEAGISHVSFKPGSVAAIKSVISIAELNPNYNIILQWTGGRAGGHHSYEDFHQPILETYSSIRKHKNLFLVFGSGFGGVEDTYPYFTGTWSKKFQYPPMPFDGVLFGSRMLVSLESESSTPAKEAIVNAKGVNDDEWELTYVKEAGGVLTVKSELGEPIHKIATRGVKLWKELDETIFNLPKEKRQEIIDKKKDYIIDRLNKDSQKVWFSVKKNGRNVDLQDMTYSETIFRLIKLTFVKNENRWLDVTLRNFVGDMILRTEERLNKTNKEYILKDFSILNNPYDFYLQFTKHYPESEHQLLTSEDVNYFLSYCLRRDMKPVPFIPLLDSNFEYWYKKDSLWQSEDLAAVYDQDVQRTCILQGPVSVKYSTKINQPVKEILNEINEGLINKLKNESYVDSNIPLIEYISFKKNFSLVNFSGVDIENNPFQTIVSITNDNKIALPDLELWLEFISGQNQSWLKALLTSDIIVQNHSYVENPLKNLFRPRYSQKIYINYENDEIKSSNITEKGLECIDCSFDKNMISLNIYEHKRGKRIALFLKFLYLPQNGNNIIYEVMQDRNERIKNFYYNLWFDNNNFEEIKNTKNTSFVSKGFLIEKKEIQKFCQSVGNKNELYMDHGQKKLIAPIDYSIVVGWEAIIKAIFPSFIDGDLLKLVHLSNSFKMLGNGPLLSGDIIDSYSEISSLTNTQSGKKVEVTAILKRSEIPLIEIKSTFLYRGKYDDYESTFIKAKETAYKLKLTNKTDICLLKSKSWIHWLENSPELKNGNVLTFNLETYSKFQDDKIYSSLEVKGSILLQISVKEFINIAEVNYSINESHGNPIIEYLKRAGKSIEPIVYFENEGYTLSDQEDSMSLRSPLSNIFYSKSSKDYNPIHTNIYFSDLAGLPGTITHGMWTSASIRTFVERFAADNKPLRVSSYSTEFVNMVLPNDKLSTKLYHIGMQNGKKVIKVETFNQDNLLVLSGTAEVDQPATAYVFTGQGSQEIGMGMKLYETSVYSKEIWDRADQYFLNNYGFSIINIVKNNPKQMTIYFGGELGNHIRNKYLSLTYDVYDENSVKQTLQLFPQIKKDSTSFEFISPEGLLYATQFTQPALTLMEMAALEDMKAKGLVSFDSPFAGHSLGEYSALASIANVLSVEALVDLVFYRGLTMQLAVKRDENGKSNFGMMAVSPTRVNNYFNQSHLEYLVNSISKISNKLIEIVNYNVENSQYVVSGHLMNLYCLTNVLNYIKSTNIDFNSLFKNNSEDFIKNSVNEIISTCLKDSNSKFSSKNLVLQRGYATIPLPGIDVPFHSSFLMPGVSAFRSCIFKKLKPTDVDFNILCNRYIPNLIAEPFQLTKDYVDKIIQHTKSHYLIKLSQSWNETSFSNYESKQNLAYTILVELLAYQFASPVKWIETQDVLFQNFNVERLIEIGPSPILSNMAQQTLKFKYEQHDDAVISKRVILSYSKNEQDIYYNYKDSDPIVPVIESNRIEPAKIEPPPMVSEVKQTLRISSSINDEGVKALDVLHVIISLKLKKQLHEVSVLKSIKDLSGGKSALQNEILGDLASEFGEIPDKSEEMPLKELGESIQRCFSGNLGKYSSNLISKLISNKLPSGFSLSTIKDRLSSTYGFGPLRTNGILLNGLSNEPGNRISNELEAFSWLDSIVKTYAEKEGISLSDKNESSASSNVKQINSEEFDKHVKKQKQFYKRQIEIYASYVGIDLLELNQLLQKEKNDNKKLQYKLDVLFDEHDEVYVEGIKPVFSPLKARFYDSYWNWSKQDAILLYFDIVYGKLKSIDREITSQCIHIMNRSEPSLINYMNYKIKNIDENINENYKLAKEYADLLLKNSNEMLYCNPVYKDVSFPTGPNTVIDEKGNIEYKESPRQSIRKLSDYVKEMKKGSHLTKADQNTNLQKGLENIMNSIYNQSDISPQYKEEIKKLYADYSSIKDENMFSENLPFLHIKKKDSMGSWIIDMKETNNYLLNLQDIADSGLSFSGKTILLTGCGSNSIGSEILKGLLSGGGKVIITTSSFNSSTANYYQSIYHRYGSKGSKLILLPFNQASKKDVDSLVEYIYNKDIKKGLGMDLDFVIPFAAISETNREINNIDGKSELAHRLMLTNLYRLLGKIKNEKEKYGYITRPAQVILPLSPNHGTFGGDGLYSESKTSLEILMNRWNSESWSNYLTVVGAVIGWTRGTGLMLQNNIIAKGIEELGVRTFSTQEMAFNILGLMHPNIVDLAQSSPVWADLNGGFQYLKDFNNVVKNIRNEINNTSIIRKTIFNDNVIDNKVINGDTSNNNITNPTLTPRANLKFEFPKLPSYEELNNLSYMKSMLNLDKVVVVTGYSEVGPYGNSRTRWEMEAYGEFSLEGCIELAWIMGYIRHFNNKLKNGQSYCGWVDSKTEEPIQDIDIKKKYEKDILDHTGIRIVEPELISAYDPNKRTVMREVALDCDLQPIEVSKEEARHFKSKHGDKVEIVELHNSDQVMVTFKKGAILFLPKALRHDRIVAAQVPTGWDPLRYGVPKDIVDQVDPATLYGLVSTVEALVSSGITDPYEFYKYVHVSEVGNCIGSGLGGVKSQHRMYRGRFLEENVQSDVLQETFINTMAAWINLLLLSASGPIKSPVGACATSIQSLEIGVETILSGKAKICLVGGYDDLGEEGVTEFGNMKATANTIDQFKMGRSPKEISRPATTSRAGFVESHGAGVNILMNASTAIEIGAPIYGIVALTNTAMDKEGRSVPAPGQGILTTAKEIPTIFNNCLLDIEYRKKQLENSKILIKLQIENEYKNIKEEIKVLKSSNEIKNIDDENNYLNERINQINISYKQQENLLLNYWGHEFYKNNPNISPLRGALSVFGLNIDDIGVASFHGTSTKANDLNESHVVNQQLEHLKRSKGNLIYTIFQKYLTGHSKGAAASWMLNGLLKVLETGIIPGNRNLDNVDNSLKKFDYLLFPSQSIHTDGIKAGILKSFGFGQVGGEALIIHPNYLFASLTETQYNKYASLNSERYKKSYRYIHNSLVNSSTLVNVKNHPPYDESIQSKVYLNPLARAKYDSKTKSYKFNEKELNISGNIDEKLKNILNDVNYKDRGVGIDVELIGNINIDNHDFLNRNFTSNEINYCNNQPDSHSSFTGKWAAKEAVFKSLSSFNPDQFKKFYKGSGGSLKDIEISNNDIGAPFVVFHNDALEIIDELKVKEVKVSISHSGEYAVAIAFSS